MVQVVLYVYVWGCVCECLCKGVQDYLFVSKHVTGWNRPWFQSQYKAHSMQLNDLVVDTHPYTQSWIHCSVHRIVLRAISSHLFTFNSQHSDTLLSLSLWLFKRNFHVTGRLSWQNCRKPARCWHFRFLSDRLRARAVSKTVGQRSNQSVGVLGIKTESFQVKGSCCRRNSPSLSCAFCRCISGTRESWSLAEAARKHTRRYVRTSTHSSLRTLLQNKTGSKYSCSLS